MSNPQTRPAAELTIRGLLVNLFDSDWEAVAIESSLSPEIIRLAVGALPVIVFAFATIGAIDLWRRDRALALMIVITAVYFIGISAGSEAEARFRVPVIPQLAIAAAASGWPKAMSASSRKSDGVCGAMPFASRVRAAAGNWVFV